ncbi:hypothetical protein [Mesorhizobium sp. B2-3-10]|uniref:hypothetical protein n=1 Tax=Mesorhizobium sp. B2-3-10 TaxID=2589954 RepID=UPI0011274E72|nr:hypothetical protein [Mesorhizobium sp. B2-3-10]TPL98316.1 hypothetical protein FJ943_15540 [Mesorhizobium sp. B2-3-10]
MTTPSDDQQPLEQPGETDGAGEAEDGWTKPETDPALVEEAPKAEAEPEEEGETAKEEEEPTEAVTDKIPDTEFLKQQTKDLRDKYSATKGEAETLRKAIRKLEADGLLDRDEIATAVGVERGYIDAVIDRKELPEPGEDGHIQQLQARFAEDYHNPTVQRGLTKVYGDKTAQGEILQAFDFAVANDPELRAKYEQTSPDDVLYFAMDEGKAALEDFREVQTNGGGARALAAKLRAANAEIAALKANPKPVTTQAETENTPAAEQEELPAPKSAREARVRAFIN